VAKTSGLWMEYTQSMENALAKVMDTVPSFVLDVLKVTAELSSSGAKSRGVSVSSRAGPITARRTAGSKRLCRR